MYQNQLTLASALAPARSRKSMGMVMTNEAFLALHLLLGLVKFLTGI
jgi:hypothetical protein